MKSLLPALLAATLTFTLNARAHGDGDWGSTNHDRCGTNDQEVMNAVVVLTATTNAPAGARGVAKIEAENDDGDKAATMELKLVGLDPADYILSVTRQSDGTNVVLGQITIGNDDEDNDGDHDGDHNCGRDQHGDWEDHDGGGEHYFGAWKNCLGWGGWQGGDHWISCNWGGFTNWGSWTNWSITNWCNASNQITVVEAEVDLPSDLNPADIARILLSDTNGVDILVGDLVKPATNTVINIRANVRLIPGAAAPSAAGVAQLLSAAVKGKWKHQFNLTASGLNARSNFRVLVNEKKTGATRSNKDGQLTIKKLPPRLPALRSLRLVDPKGNEAARAQF